MSDDPWRRRGDEDDDDFGPPLFGDDPAERRGRVSFGSADAGPLSDWTDAPTGDVPALVDNGGSDDVDVWSTFSGEVPVWTDDSTDPHGSPGAGLESLHRPLDEPAPRGGLFDDEGSTGAVRRVPRRDTGGVGRVPIGSDDIGGFDDTGAFGDTGGFGDDDSGVRLRPTQGRIQIGTDPTSEAMSRPPLPARGPRTGEVAARPARPPRPSGPARPTPTPVGGTKGRDMPTAIAVGIVILGIFIGAVKAGPKFVAIIVVLVLGLAAVEFFDRVREKGYGPAFIPGIVACVAAPLAAYNYGDGALAVVAFLAFVACLVAYIGGGGLDTNPLPNMAITCLGITWIGILGSFGAAILGLSNRVGDNVGTDTLFLMAIAIVANDVGALFVGSAVGRTPLRDWISPNKSVEGLLGGTVMTLGTMVIVGVWGKSTTWDSTSELLLLGLVVSVMAPIGDLAESMFKRNLGVKDFGSIIRGHGGVLDRFDGFLLTMPAVYFLATSMQPWI